MSAFNEREAKLLPTLLNVLVAGMCDPSRLSRGRTTFRQGAVIEIDVAAGEISGTVQGSRREPYRVTVQVSAAKDLENLKDLVPKARDVMFDCTCPDWESPCKHGVAVMSGFAQLVADRPPVLALWRGAGAPAGSPRASVGSRASRQLPEPVVQISDQTRESLQRLLGTVPTFGIPELSSLRLPPVDAWDEPWLAMLDDALHHLARTTRP